MGKNDFIMPFKYRSRFASWSSEKVKAILMAMFEYNETGVVPKLPPEYEDAFEAIRCDMDIVRVAYEERCRINSENGKKGGAPKGNQNARKTTETTETTENNRNKPKIREDKIREDKIDSLNNKKKERNVSVYTIKEYLQ